MNAYQKGKERARQDAIKWQNNFDGCLSWGELFKIANHFEKLAKRYGLIKEFRENAII